MVRDKIKNIKDTLHSFPTGTTMGLEYLVDLGKESQKTYPIEDRVREHFISGCTSNAWIKLENKDPIQINTVSDSLIISGLLYLLENTFNGEPKSSIDSYSGQDLIDGFGLDGHISSQRLRGFDTAVRMMKQQMKKNWVYYMQEGLKSMWKLNFKSMLKKKKTPDTYRTNVWGDDDWADPNDKKNSTQNR